MDPNETLRRMRGLVRDILHGVVIPGQASKEGFAKVEQLSEAEMSAAGHELAGLVDALDGWLTKKGHLPSAWR